MVIRDTELSGSIDYLAKDLSQLLPSPERYAQVSGGGNPYALGGAVPEFDFGRWANRVGGGSEGFFGESGDALTGALDFFSRAEDRREQRKRKEEAEKATAQDRQRGFWDRVTGRGYTGGDFAAADWSGPATASDNEGLTAEAVDGWIARTRPNSPLAGMGGFILQTANQLGVSVPLALGIMLKESELGTTAGPNKNLAGVTDPSRDEGLGGKRAFVGHATWQDAVTNMLRNLATPLYRGKSVAEQVGTWYVGPQEWGRAGMDATDRAGNGTVRDYVNLVGQVYQGLGRPMNPGATGTRRAAGGGDGIQKAMSLQGTRYTFGGIRETGNPADGVDCSSLVGWALGMPRDTWTAQTQYNISQRVDQREAKPGDLVFFQGTYDTGRGEYITHVGIYLGNGRMINAQTEGVRVADLNDPYWRQHFVGFGRWGGGARASGGGPGQVTP